MTLHKKLVLLQALCNALGSLFWAGDIDEKTAVVYTNVELSKIRCILVCVYLSMIVDWNIIVVCLSTFNKISLVGRILSTCCVSCPNLETAPAAISLSLPSFQCAKSWKAIKEPTIHKARASGASTGAISSSFSSTYSSSSNDSSVSSSSSWPC